MERLAEHLAERMSLPLIAVSVPGEAAEAASAAPPGTSEAELAGLLDDELAAVERLLQSGRKSSMTTTPTDTSASLRRALTSLQEMRARLEAAERRPARADRRRRHGVPAPRRRQPGGVLGAAAARRRRHHRDARRPLGRDGAVRPDAGGRRARSHTRWGGFLDGSTSSTPPSSASRRARRHRWIPQQRLLLEVAWEALEDGRPADRRLAGSRPASSSASTATATTTTCMQAADPAGLDLYSGTGTSHSIARGRLSYLLDLRGPEPGRRHGVLVVAGGRAPRRARACAPASARWPWPAAST